MRRCDDHDLDLVVTDGKIEIPEIKGVFHDFLKLLDEKFLKGSFTRDSIEASSTRRR